MSYNSLKKQNPQQRAYMLGGTGIRELALHGYINHRQWLAIGHLVLTSQSAFTNNEVHCFDHRRFHLDGLVDPRYVVPYVLDSLELKTYAAHPGDHDDFDMLPASELAAREVR
jgi:hypothetical protein